MEKFKEILEKIISTILITPDDSDTERAKKIIWYAFFGSIILIFIVSWLIFVLFTFTADIVKVPNIEGDYLYKALEKLSERKLVSTISPKYSNIYPEGIVFDQSPSPGSVVKKGRVVFLSVSLGDQSMALPDFRGYTLFDLADFLDKTYVNTKIPYKFDPIIYEFNNSVEKGRIIKQEPSDGTPLKEVKKVKLWVSNGIKDSTEKTLPNFVGKKIDEISNKIEELGIFYNIDFKITNNKNENMIIAEQSIGEGALISELIEETKPVIFSTNIYKEINGEKIEGFITFSIPKKPLPFNFEVKIKKLKDPKERSVINIKTKGGIDFPIPYYDKDNAIINIYYNGKLEKEIIVKEEIEKNK